MGDIVQAFAFGEDRSGSSCSESEGAASGWICGLSDQAGVARRSRRGECAAMNAVIVVLGLFALLVLFGMLGKDSGTSTRKATGGFRPIRQDDGLSESRKHGGGAGLRSAGGKTIEKVDWVTGKRVH